MTRYQVVIDPKADEDIDQALPLLKQASHKVGEWLDSLESEILSLQTMAERCSLAPENNKGRQNWRFDNSYFD